MKEFIRKIIVFLLTLEARAILNKYKPKIIVVTGSVGKTSTRDATYAALKHHTFVRKSEKSFNSDVGVPLTVLGVPNGWGSVSRWIKNLADGLLILLFTTPYPRWLVIEVGADRPGDLSKSLRWVKPDVVVTTRFPEVPVHVEFYSSPQEVVKEELFPVTQLGVGGVAVLNIDDEHARSITLSEGVDSLTYGLSKDADVHASHYRTLVKKGLPRGISFDVSHKNETIHLSFDGVLGKTHVYATLAGIAGALAAGAQLSKMKTLEEEYHPAPGRMRLVSGIQNTLLIDDSYNSSPEASEKGLQTLGEIKTSGKRIAVLADMMELGTFSLSEHMRIGEIASQNTDVLVTVGVRARGISEGALKGGMKKSAIQVFEKGSEAAQFLKEEIKEGDVILIKGSQSMRMENVTKALMKVLEEASELLPRQDAEWLIR